MYNYTLQRYEKYKDKDGNVVSIFVAVGIDDGLSDSLTQEHWLNQDEIALVLSDENNLIPILERVAAEGTIRLQNEVVNKPQPPEVSDETKRKTLFHKIDKTAIESKVAGLKKLNEIK